MFKVKTKNKQKVVVAMSGGVDSSVSAALLREAGYDVVGVFMRCWNADDFTADTCTAEEDEYWARRAAGAIGIPFYSVDLVKEYKKRVVDYFISEYKAGRTPNPDVMCNNEIKFGVFYDKVMAQFSASYIATGHYARVSGGKLLKGVDHNKDQTYFLNRVPADRLNKVMFPIGEYTKPQVRELARKFNLPNAQKKDSQGLCFIGKVDVNKFLKQYIPQKNGDIVTTGGKKVGKHTGAYYFTIGQRHGLGVGGGTPYYVVDKNVKTNTVVVGMRYDKNLFARSIKIQNPNWLSQPKDNQNVEVSIRYRQEPQKAKILKINNNEFKINFKEPQRAITAGQSAVVYSKDALLGGGIIV